MCTFLQGLLGKIPFHLSVSLGMAVGLLMAICKPRGRETAGGVESEGALLPGPRRAENQLHVISPRTFPGRFSSAHLQVEIILTFTEGIIYYSQLLYVFFEKRSTILTFILTILLGDSKLIISPFKGRHV